jgi:ribosome-binding protein aMBF1 (putative translation factor)
MLPPAEQIFCMNIYSDKFHAARKQQSPAGQREPTETGNVSRMDLRDIFATNLRRLRNAKGLLSRGELAYQAKISRSYLSQIEKGSFYVSLKVIGKLARILGVEPEEFLKRTGKWQAR